MYWKTMLFFSYSYLVMRIDDKIRGGKLRYDINRDAAKILALSSGKVNKYEYLTGEEYCPLVKGK